MNLLMTSTHAERYRLVTRSDFDGLVCAALLKHLGILDDILFVHPKDVQDGKVEMGPNMKYAYGFMETIDEGQRCIGHSGGAPGMNGKLTICDNGYTIAVLANLDPPAADEVEQFVLARLPLR